MNFYINLNYQLYINVSDQRISYLKKICYLTCWKESWLIKNSFKLKVIPMGFLEHYRKFNTYKKNENYRERNGTFCYADSQYGGAG